MILVVDPDPGFHARVRERLEPHEEMHSADTVGTAGVTLAGPMRFDIVFLGPGLELEAVLELATSVRDTTPEVSVVVVAAVMTSESLRQLLRAGVRDVLPASFNPKQLAASISHASAAAARERERFGHAATPGGRGKVITVLSAKGGVGRSFIASNLAVLLATPAEPVALVDLDLEFGDLSVFFQTQPKHTIGDAAGYPDGLDEVALGGMLTHHRTNVHLLAAPQEPGMAETISSELVRQVIDLLSRRYRYVVIDTPASFTDHVLTAIDASDVLPTVTAMDVASIRSAGLCLRTLEMLGVPNTKVRLVLNRADSRVGLNLAEVEKALGTKIAVSIPSSREVPLSVNQGTPLAAADPRSAVTRSLAELVTVLGVDTTSPPPRTSRRSLLGRTR